MPVNGLPITLENLINTILKDNGVQSWQMKGFSGYTHVILKFKMDDSTSQSADFTYKRKPKLQAMRDRKRADKWNTPSHDFTHIHDEQRKILDDNSEGEMRDFDCVTGNQQGCNQDTDSKHVNHNSTAALPKAGYDPGLEHGSPSICEKGLADQQSAIIYSGSADIEKSPGVNNNITELSADGDLRSGIDRDESDDTEYEQEEEELTQCKECHVAIRGKSDTKWMTCTICRDYHMCNTCWAGGKHQHHQSQVHAYTWHGEVNDLPYSTCDSCGYLYNHDNPYFQVWICSECEYVSLCKKCFEEDMHNHHKHYIRKKLLSTYVYDLVGVRM